MSKLLYAVINYLLCNSVSIRDMAKFDCPRGYDDRLYTERIVWFFLTTSNGSLKHN